MTVSVDRDKRSGLLKMLNGKWTSYTKTNSHLPDDTILSLAANPDGTILAGFTDGHIRTLKPNNRVTDEIHTCFAS
jgi:hypothetical protein